MASSSSSSRQLKHQVFLSFRVEDTGHNFTSHLREALKGKGLDVFFDEEKLEKGEQLSEALSKAIAASNISVIILSVNYASSESCLAELSKIMDRKRTEGQIALPIFYHVDPSDVRNLGGSFKTSCYGCESLVELPCLDHLTSLETLDLHGCKSLVELPCLNHSTSLETLDLHGCKSLVELPCLKHLISLETLDIDGCYKLKKFPTVPHKFSGLQKLVVSYFTLGYQSKSKT